MLREPLPREPLPREPLRGNEGDAKWIRVGAEIGLEQLETARRVLLQVEADLDGGQSEDGARQGDDVAGAAHVAGKGLVGQGTAGRGAELAQVMDEQQPALVPDGEAIEKAEEIVDGGDLILDAAASRAEAVDDDERGAQRGDHFQQVGLAGGRIEIERLIRSGQHGVETAAVHAPGHRTGVEQLGRSLGVDVDDISAGRSAAGRRRARAGRR